VLVCVGGLFSVLKPGRDVAAQTSRSYQVWPEHTIGVVSGRLEGAAHSADPGVLPSGVYAAPSGGIVRGRTYLFFPTDVFPAGTDILRATLYFYVDSISNRGQANAGAYRVLEGWGETGWQSDPRTWPAVFTTPQDVALLDFSGAALVDWQSEPRTLPVMFWSAQAAAPLEFGSVQGMHSQSPLPTGTAPPSPLATPTSTPLLPSATPSQTATPPGTATPTRAATQTPYPTPSSSVQLVAVNGAWITWDVTGLMRAWASGEVANYGLAIGVAPSPGAGVDEAGNLLVARLTSAGDSATRPYVIVEAEVRPVTPTPWVLLPTAGVAEPGPRFKVVGFILLGMALVVTAIALRRG